MITPYKLEKVKRDDGKRAYKTPTGGVYLSVSTILSHGNFGVLNWRKKVGNEEANKVSREACKRGTRLHQMIHEYFSLNQLPEAGEFDWFDKVYTILQDMTPVLSESSIWNDDEEYAGTFDLLCQYKGKTTIVDWKTSRQPKSIKMCQNHFAQIAAYAKGIELVYGIKIERGAVIIINEESWELQEFGLSPTSLTKYFDVFCQKNQIFKEYYAKNPVKTRSEIIANIPTWGIGATLANLNNSVGRPCFVTGS